MLLYLELTDGRCFHHVGKVCCGSKKPEMEVYIINVLGQVEEKLIINVQDILLIGSYEYLFNK